MMTAALKKAFAERRCEDTPHLTILSGGRTWNVSLAGTQILGRAPYRYSARPTGAFAYTILPSDISGDTALPTDTSGNTDRPSDDCLPTVPPGVNHFVPEPSPREISDILIDSRALSKHQGLFSTGEDGCFYTDAGSGGMTIYNGTLLPAHSAQRLHDGDLLRICAGNGFPEDHDVLMIFTDHTGKPRTHEAAPTAVPSPHSGKKNSLEVNIRERAAGIGIRRKVLLRDIRFEIPAGSMVLILGGSGAGKTTLMNVMMGYEPADASILYAGEDLYQNYDCLKYEIGYVPQQDLLRLNDTVEDTLENAAAMRLPSSLSKADVENRLNDTLAVLGLETCRNTLAGKLSGGQRKRLSIGVELIGNPSLFFLDEPDSGLDGSMAAQLMYCLRKIADMGKTVTVISHSPDRAASLFDYVIVLAKDNLDGSGRLAFCGTTREALECFRVGSLEQIVRKINRRGEGGEGLGDYYIGAWNGRLRKLQA